MNRPQSHPELNYRLQVEHFANQHGLNSEVELLKKGALVAQDPAGYQSLPELSEDEKHAFYTEVTKKWSHPFKLYMTVAVCSIGAAVQGWDQTGTNGANLAFPDAFGLASGSESDNWIIGLVNSGPYIGSAFLGCWLSDPCNRFFGRRGTIFASAIILIATPIGGAVCRTWEQLLITRLLMGVGMGLKGATTPVFAAENAPAAIRGALVMTWQVSCIHDALGTIHTDLCSSGPHSAFSSVRPSTWRCGIQVTLAGGCSLDQLSFQLFPWHVLCTCAQKVQGGTSNTAESKKHTDHC